ncbi:ABC transporter substrate-binding protein [Deinococcus misasensis]|uniref:ABC transporter substrate-binding protein n=1 Tax=Deinococcus misasensis TaxID=392413 RepID=UPI0005588AD8|nr:iron-siderophore ABC transporter substrate-binding protein [Deinococcus misasensis]
MKLQLSVTFALLSGFSSAATFKHDAGTVNLDKTPKRIVALGPHALDLLLSLGVQPVGYGEAAQLEVTNFGEPLKQIKYLGKWVTSAPVNVGDRFNPNLEVLMALKPDLIVGETFASGVYNQLSQIAPTMLFSGTGRNEWKRTLPLLARAVGRELQAAQTLNGYRKYIAQARKAVQPLVKSKRFMVAWNSGFAVNNTFTVLSGNDYTAGVLEDLGVKLVAAPNNQPTLSLEGIGALKPDAVLVLSAGKNTPEAARQDWFNQPLLKALPVSKQQQVYFLDYHPFGRIRGPLAAKLVVEQLQKTLKPD